MSDMPEYVVVRQGEVVLQTNRVLRKTYLLLSLNFLFSALVASVTLMGFLPIISPTGMMIGMFGLLFLTQALRGSRWALGGVFAFTGFMGYSLAPLLVYYLATYANGAELVGSALLGTGVIFMALSLYATITRRDFSYSAGFLLVALCVLLLASIANIFLQLELLSILLASAFVLISSGMILFKTSQIIQGGEDDYIMATVSLYVSVFNLFVSLLRVLSFFSGNRRN